MLKACASTASLVFLPAVALYSLPSGTKANGCLGRHHPESHLQKQMDE
jgi:hypothetical protein